MHSVTSSPGVENWEFLALSSRTCRTTDTLSSLVCDITQQIWVYYERASRRVVELRFTYRGTIWAAWQKAAGPGRKKQQAEGTCGLRHNHHPRGFVPLLQCIMALILSSWILNWPVKFNSRVRVKVPKHTPRLLPNNKILKHAIQVTPVLGTHNYITTVCVSRSRPHVKPIASLRDSDMQQAYSGLQYTVFETLLICLEPGKLSLYCD